MTGFLTIDRVSKQFGGERPAVDDVSLSIGRGEFFALLGPSGCGKTTLLRMIAGLEQPGSGRIAIDGEEMTGLPANRRPVNLVFQNYALFPHMSVVENVEYGLMVTGAPAAERRTQAMDALALVQLAELAQRRPGQLSGGQRQRVALARALVKRPKVLLLDEPLSALDAKLREAMQLELARLQRQLGITFIIVTHDQDEALSIASRIAVMDGGRVQQVGSPMELYERPASRFVAGFIGRINLIDATIAARGAGWIECVAAELGPVRIPAPGDVGAENDSVTLAVRPERVRIGLERPEPGRMAVEAEIEDLAYFGDVSRLVAVTAGGQRLQARLPVGMTPGEVARGERRWLSWLPEETLLLER
jgi:spermidine/putrescine ABC transporter ATP-binding subunit